MTPTYSYSHSLISLIIYRYISFAIWPPRFLMLSGVSPFDSWHLRRWLGTSSVNGYSKIFQDEFQEYDVFMARNIICKYFKYISSIEYEHVSLMNEQLGRLWNSLPAKFFSGDDTTKWLNGWWNSFYQENHWGHDWDDPPSVNYCIAIKLGIYTVYI